MEHLIHNYAKRISQFSEILSDGDNENDEEYNDEQMVFDTKLIKAVKLHPCLYAKKVLKSSVTVDTAWENVASELGVTGIFLLQSTIV